MNKLLKDELGHRGYVMSDWNGTFSSSSMGFVSFAD
jgi:beta-glucosidase-like glycosyl hydrolase